MTPIMWLNLVLGLIILAIALNWAYFQIMGRRSATIISEDEFAQRINYVKKALPMSIS